jgi:hypothetical protein
MREWREGEEYEREKKGRGERRDDCFFWMNKI